MTKPQVAHVSASVSRLAGGLFDSVRHLSVGVHDTGAYTINVLSLQDSRSAADAAHWQPLPVQTFPVVGPQRLGYSPNLNAALRAQNPALVHLHGLWQYPSRAVLQWARQTGRPYIISPHGMMEPWALQQSRFKKWLVGKLYHNACLRRANVIRVTSQLELESVRAAGWRNPIAIVPNGVVLPDLRELPDVRHVAANRKRRALFLSRIHPKKGLLNLLQAWATLQGSNLAASPLRDWELYIVGPDECNHLAEVKAAVQQHRLQAQVVFLDETRGTAKTRLYRESDLFVLPTFSENFGLVIAEALSCEVPVITTRATPWGELESHRCGWWIDVGVAPLVTALRAATAVPVSTIQQMGQRGRALVEQHYTWPPIGKQMAAVYDWVLGRGPKPECVQ